MFTTGNPLTSSIPPIRSIQKSQQQQQQYSYSKFRNESSSFEGSGTPTSNPTTASSSTKKVKQEQAEGVLIDLSEDSKSLQTNGHAPSSSAYYNIPKASATSSPKSNSKGKFPSQVEMYVLRNIVLVV